jgi:hypothetical protein
LALLAAWTLLALFAAWTLLALFAAWTVLTPVAAHALVAAQARLAALLPGEALLSPRPGFSGLAGCTRLSGKPLLALPTARVGRGVVRAGDGLSCRGRPLGFLRHVRSFVVRSMLGGTERWIGGQPAVCNSGQPRPRCPRR